MGGNLVNHIALLTVVALAFGIASVVLISHSGTKTNHLSDYQAKFSLLSPAELHFKKFLDTAIPSTSTVMVQVSLEEIVNVKPRVRGKDWARARGKIKARRVDFVVCDRENFTILCAIELNDRSHARVDRKIRDMFLREALKSADIPFMEIACNSTYDSAALRAQITPAIAQRAA